MKKCPYCGIEYADDIAMCPTDHTVFAEQSSMRPHRPFPMPGPWYQLLAGGMWSLFGAYGLFGTFMTLVVGGLESGRELWLFFLASATSSAVGFGVIRGWHWARYGMMALASLLLPFAFGWLLYAEGPKFAFWLEMFVASYSLVVGLFFRYRSRAS